MKSKQSKKALTKKKETIILETWDENSTLLKVCSRRLTIYKNLATLQAILKPTNK